MYSNNRTFGANRGPATRLGGKVNDTRTIIGGEVQSKAPGKELFVIALDFSAQYPAQTEANNISTNTRVDERIVHNPERYGLECIKHKHIRDCYDNREVYWLKHSPSSPSYNDKTKDIIYRIEQFNCAYKNNVDEIKKALNIIESFNISEERLDKAIHLPDGCLTGIFGSQSVNLSSFYRP